jgi:signal transduction histidine kinase/CheY-like chemotaxis protein
VRFLPHIGYGTEGYPEKVARRLRALNLATWIVAAVASGFAVVRFLDPTPGVWKAAAVNAFAALIFALVPLLHRFGPLWAAVSIFLFAYAYLFVLIWLLGTGTGMQMLYLVVAGFTFLLFGIERVFLSALFGVLALLLVVVLQVFAPHDTGLLGPVALFGSFVAAAVATVTLLTTGVFYALREAARAEENLAREHEATQDKSRQLESRTNDLSEALQVQTTTADVLKVIGRSAFDLRAVLNTLAEAAARLCEADASAIARQRGAAYYHVAHYGVPPGSDDLVKNLPLLPGRGSVVGRVLVQRKSVQIPDVLADPEYTVFEFQEALGIRTLLGVPLLREGKTIGVFLLWRRAVRPFSNKQIELLTTFADQAAIAIENARLFEEVHARTGELAEALEQQRATAEILRVIGTSPTDTQPVFDTIVRNAVSLCGSLFANVFRFDGGLLHFVTSYNVGPDYLYLLRTRYPMQPDPSQVSGRVLLTKSIVRLEDVLTDPDYDQQFPKAMGWRRMLGVPMLRKGEPVGVVVVGWAEAGPVPEAQEELLKTFADQAVIAIENARLFSEIQDKSQQLEIANKYKSHFLASASHDLRQPLHALNLFVAQLQAETDLAERRRLVERIDASVGSMNELFEALLDMTKLDAGILEPNLTEFSVARLLDRIETTFGDAAHEKGLRLRVVASGAWVRSDSILLERILLNLVSNAVRYTAHGGVVVGCRRRGNELRIEVCDNGAGIPEDQRKRIFSEFYQLTGPAPDRQGGLGLGLAIVDRLGRLLGHPIQLDSRPGRGSRFSVTVPLAAHPVAALQAPLPAIADPAHGKRVMVIDDDALVLDGMRGILQSWGCQVETAASGEAALAALAANGGAPDLIISDSRLADGKTGIEAIERLREALGAPVPAFVITGDTAPERLREASAGGYHLLHKPVSPMALRTTLNRLLRAQEGRVPLPARQ